MPPLISSLWKNLDDFANVRLFLLKMSFEVTLDDLLVGGGWGGAGLRG